MFFKKRQKPKLKEHLIQKAELIINGDYNPIAQTYTKFLAIILNKPRFGNKQKDKIRLDNDVSVFELIAYSIAKLILYLEYNETDKKSVPFNQLYKFKDDELENIRKYDIIDIFQAATIKLHNDYLGWKDVNDLLQNRIEFYLSHNENTRIIHKTLYSIVENSTETKKPIQNIFDLKNEMKLIAVTDLTFFTINIEAFEIDILGLAFEIVSEFLESNKESSR